MDKNLYRILSGLVRCHINEAIYIVRPLKLVTRYRAEEIYEEALEDALQNGCWSQKDYKFINYLFLNGLRPDYKERLQDIEKDIEDKKVEIFELATERKDSTKQRESLIECNKENNSVFGELHKFDYLTAEGIAEIQKSRFLLEKSLGRYQLSNGMLDKIAAHLVENRIQESEYRKIARSNEWALIKGAAEFINLKKDVYTDEQLNFYYWANFYDNIYQHPDKPLKHVIDDDIALDGWCIVQLRKSSGNDARRYVDGKIVSADVANSQEVVVFGGKEMAKTIYDANDGLAKGMMKAKFNAINKGKYDESKHG
jgi:hypothetical protein